MEGSDKGFSSSNTHRSPLVPKSSPSGSGENNENDTSQDQMISKLHNPKKPVAKNFMSPTISASSKVAVPRKKILAERNENSSFFDTQIWKTQDMDMKNSVGHYDLSPSWFIPSKNCGSVSNGDGVVTYSSLKPYAPSTNYLSLRPKYLRYDPNRRCMIFPRKVSESREGKDGTGIVEVESSADAQDSLVHAQENEENLGEVDDNADDDDVEEDEEEEDEEVGEYEGMGWSLRRVLKFLLTFYVCFLSKTYIYSMNSSTLSPIQQAILGFKDDYTMIQKQICEAAYMEVYGGGFLEVEERESGLEVHNILMAEGDNLETVDSGDAEMVEEDELDMEKRNTETVESHCDYEVSKNREPYNVQMFEVDNVEKVKNSEVGLVEFNNVEKVKNSEVELVEVDNMERIENSEAEMVENEKLDMEDSNTESVEYDCDNEVVKSREFSEEVSSAVVAKSKVIEGCEVEYIAEAKTAQSDDAGRYELGKEVECSDQLKKPDSFQEDQMPLNTKWVNQPGMELLESHEMHVNLVDEEFDYDCDNEVVKSREFSEEVSSAVVAKSKVIEGCEVEYIAEAKTAQSDDAGSYELGKEVECSDQLKKPDSFQEDQMPLNTKWVNQPGMELLESHEMHVNLVDEEFDYGGKTENFGINILVVAGVSTFSIILASLAFVCRSRKGKTTSIEDSQPMLKPFKSTVEDRRTQVRLAMEEELIEKTMTPVFPAEEEEHNRKEIESSTRPLSLSNSIAEAPHEASRFIHAPTIELLGEIVIKGVGSSHRKIPVLESSYGSFTGERKILKEEGGKYGEPKIEFTTPVRRSSRIRNRAVMSP